MMGDIGTFARWTYLIRNRRNKLECSIMSGTDGIIQIPLDFILAHYTLNLMRHSGAVDTQIIYDSFDFFFRLHQIWSPSPRQYSDNFHQICPSSKSTDVTHHFDRENLCSLHLWSTAPPYFTLTQCLQFPFHTAASLLSRWSHAQNTKSANFWYIIDSGVHNHILELVSLQTLCTPNGKRKSCDRS